jgi:hypothetical protein
MRRTVVLCGPWARIAASSEPIRGWASRQRPPRASLSAYVYRVERDQLTFFHADRQAIQQKDILKVCNHSNTHMDSSRILALASAAATSMRVSVALASDNKASMRSLSLLVSGPAGLPRLTASTPCSAIVVVMYLSLDIRYREWRHAFGPQSGTRTGNHNVNSSSGRPEHCAGRGAGERCASRLTRSW